MRLSLRQRFLVAPIVGLIIVLALTASYFFQSESQNKLIEKISDSDLKTLSQYTKLFTGLSRYHLEMYELFNAAGQQVDEGALYDKGVFITDKISEITEEMEKLVRSRSGEETLPDSEANQLLSEITNYRTAAISSVENTTVSLSKAPIYLSKANQHFSFLHQKFANKLDAMRNHIQDEAEQQLESTRQKTIILAIVGLSSAIGLVILSFIAASLLSRKIRFIIDDLFNLTEASNHSISAENNASDEVERLILSLKSFEESLKTVQQQENDLKEANRQLQAEIEVKLRHQIELEKTQKELERRVEERTANLYQANQELEEEISHRKSAEESLKIYREIILNTDEAILVTDEKPSIIEVNPAYERMSGYSKEELIGRNPSLISSGFHTSEFYENMWKSIQQKGRWSEEIWNKKKNGEVFPAWAVVNAIKSDENRVQYFIGLYRDISELKQAEARLEQLAFYDPLTNLPNRTLLNEKIRQEIASLKRHGEKMALLFIDLDNFKNVNDTLGHKAGDQLLVEVSRRLTNMLRESDIISRISGDEFNIVLTQLKDLSVLNKICQKIVDGLAVPYLINKERVNVSSSIGVSIFPDDSDHIETLRKYSDMAMYQAKSMGKNQFHRFTPELQSSREYRLELEKALIEAVCAEKFSLVYQPIINYRTDEIVAAEALIRWNHNDKPVPPDVFIPLCEESELIYKIDEWVLKKVCQSVAEWNKKTSKQISAQVNMSSKYFQRKDTPDTISQFLEKYGLPGSQLCIEITETAVMSDAHSTKNNIQKIQKMGVQVALDDFGTGFSSLNYITQFSMDKIKIDRSFVKDLDSSPQNQAVVDALIKLANRLGILVVAEGVETNLHHDYLKSAGCHFGQGYHYCKPVPEDMLLKMIDQPGVSTLDVMQNRAGKT